MKNALSAVSPVRVIWNFEKEEEEIDLIGKKTALSAIFSGQQISTEMGPKIFFLQMVLDDVLSNNIKCHEVFRPSN